MNRRETVAATVAMLLTGGWTRVKAEDGTLSASPAPQTVPGFGLRWQLNLAATGRHGAPDFKPGSIWVQFRDTGELEFAAECVIGNAHYTVAGSRLTIGPPVITPSDCQPSATASTFVRDLEHVVTALLTSEAADQLVLELKADGGQLIFTPMLTGIVWEWVELRAGDGTVTQPTSHVASTIEFTDDGFVSIVTDCNSAGGTVTVDGTAIEFELMATLMGCPAGSQGDQLLQQLSEAVSFVVSEGCLLLNLPGQQGAIVFAPQLA